jgi:transposase-like protein
VEEAVTGMPSEASNDEGLIARSQSVRIFLKPAQARNLRSFHHVSDAHLPLYLNEFAFRFNHRKDPEMFEKMLQTVER